MKKNQLQAKEEQERKRQMKTNWYGSFPVIQNFSFKKIERKVEPAEESGSLHNNDKQEDNYSARSKQNDKERQDMCNYWKMLWKI